MTPIKAGRGLLRAYAAMFPRRVAVRSRLLSALAAASLLAGPALAQTAIPPPLTAAERNFILGAVQAESGVRPPALDDATLTAAAQAWARAEAGQRVQPSRIERFWSIEAPRRDISREFDAARIGGRLDAWLATLSPADPRYRQLAAARDRYRLLVAAGGWTKLPPGKLAKDDRGPLALALRQRLVAEGYATGPGLEPDRFDADLAAALTRFQARHGLAVDGVLGPATRAALDVSAEDRLTQIEMNLERWRWLPRVLPADRIEVDIGAAEAVLYRAGQPRLRMRTVVGAPVTMTPMFASRVDTVVFNPPWNVPVSIAAKEITPKAVRDPTYLARHHYMVTPNGLQQLPGPDNALGQIKFDLPSPFGVYLHDTPSRGAFARPVRTLSHGCVRLEKPLDLARDLLGVQGWSADEIDAALAAKSTRRVSLTTPVPLFVVYRTASVDEAGDLQFRRDAYGWDAQLAAALAAAR